MPFATRFPETEKPEKTYGYKRFAEAGISYLAADPEELSRFMSATGYDTAQLRAAIGSNELALAAMDYFAANEPALLAMCSNMKLDVAQFMACWQRNNQSM